MVCQNQLSHIIQPGDSLYKIANDYQMTIQEILALNPTLQPYNLQIGAEIIICPGESGMPRPKPVPDSHMGEMHRMSLHDDMRLAWEQHVYWTRHVMISIIENLSDQDATVARLMKNPKDIADIYARYYPNAVAKTIEDLLTEHLDIGGKLITALRDGNSVEAAMLNTQWYANADKMAEAFSKINPYYNKDELTKMLYRHLDLTKEEVSMRLAKNYPADIKAFKQIEQEALEMADYFTSGIMKQYPEKFM